MADQNVVRDAADEHIGTAKHRIRNLLLGIVAVAGVGLIGLFYWSSAKSDTVAIEQLHSFRKSLGDKCNKEQFRKPASPQLESLYADSSRMQAVVRTQLANLQQANVDCEQILKSLKSVDFPVE